MRAGLVWALGIASIAWSCGSSEDFVYGAPSWPADHSVVAVALDEDRRAVWGPTLFEAGAPVEVPAPGSARRLQLFTYADPERDLARCGVRLGGAQPNLPSASLQFEAALTPDRPLELEPLASSALDLRYERCAPQIDTCPSLRADLIDVPNIIDGDVHGLARAEDGTVFVSAPFGGTPGSPQLMRLDGDRLLPEPHAAGAPEQGFESLAASPLGLWASQGADAWRFDPSGGVDTSTRAPAFIDGLSAGPDGSVLARHADGDGPGLVDLTGAVPALTEPVLSAVAAGAGRTFALTERGILRFDGSEWVVDYPFSVVEGWQVIGGDVDAVAAANNVGEILIRDESTGDWQRHVLPSGFGFKVRVVVSLGPDRFVLGGNEGSYALWWDGNWCLQDRVVSNVIISGVATADRRTAYLGTGNLPSVRGDPPFLLRVSVEP